MSEPSDQLSVGRLSRSSTRHGDLPLGAVIRTDERYGRDPVIQGPRGWHYWNRLENPKDYQNPNLWGDTTPTYFVGQLKLPVGARVTLRGSYPHARYFKIAAYRYERSTFVALGGEDLAAWDIKPDPGSTNPYLLGADRTAEQRSYTVHIVTDDAPADEAQRAVNTMYVGSEERSVQLIFRVFVPDAGYDGAGLGLGDTPSTIRSIVTCEATLADGTHLSSREVADRFGETIGAAPAPVATSTWYQLISADHNDPSLDPASAPARTDAAWEVFRGIKYTVAGAFMSPEDKALLTPQTEMEGGGDPTTVYLMNFLNRKFGPVYAFRARMPTFPDTYSGAGAGTMGDGQVKYWSVVTAASAPCGELWDGVYDLQVPVDDAGYYTVVVSRPEDRPSNATHDNGFAWIDWGPGEGLDDPRNRPDWGLLIMRFMACDPNWEHSPALVLQPGQEQAIMGPYYPQGIYTTPQNFEKRGNSMFDSGQITNVTIDNTRGMRFAEVLVVKADGAQIYNTSGLNDAPAELWDSLDPAALAAEHDAFLVHKNGPKFWVMDSQTVALGKTAWFGGLDARWGATVPPELLAKGGAVPYEVFCPEKTQRMVYEKGQLVYELIDADGHVYVLQAHGPEFTLDSLSTLGERFKDLPEGWRYRTRVLTEDLILDLGPDATIYGVGDEFHQYYTRIPADSIE